MNTLTTLFLVALTGSVLLQLWLTRRHMKHVRFHRNQVPQDFNGKLSLEEHQKAADYALTKARYSNVDLLYSSVLLLLWTLGGGLQWLDSTWLSFGLGNLTAGVGFMLCAFLLMSLLNIPLSAYRTFVIEQRFGFNNMTVSLFVADFLKEVLLTLALGLPLAYVVLWLMDSSGPLWWLYVWLVWIGFTTIMMWAYPAWIAPLFNKFSPLADEALVKRIDALLTRCGFANNGIFIMDGSRRSGHGNAYFTGFGSNKRIVFFDTLIKSLTNEEVEAVLAHELGHFKHRHVIKRMISTAGLSLLGLALLGWLMQQDWFYQGLGISQPSNHAALMLFLLVTPVVSIFFQPVSSFIMRKHEFEADDYASQQSSAADLIRALVKLYKENSSTLTPDPLYSAFHDSHPPAPIRIAFLSSKLKQEVSI